MATKLIGNRVNCMNSFLEEEITSGRFVQALKKQYNVVTIATNAMNIRAACFEVWLAVATAYEDIDIMCEDLAFLVSDIY